MSPTSAPTSGPGKWLVLGAMLWAPMNTFLDTNSLSTALPQMQGSLGVSLEELAWVPVAAFIASLVTSTMAAWGSDLLGRRRFYLGSLLVCTVMSILCGLTRSIALMIAFRVLYGLGNGGLIPMSHATILNAFPAQERGTAMGIYGMAPAIAAIIGQLGGGWLVDTYGWHWVFYLNALAGLLALAMAYPVVRDDPSTQRQLTRIDVPGIALLVVICIALQLVLQLGARHNWFESAFIVEATLVALVSLAAFVWWELRVDDPVVQLRVLTNRQCLAGTSLVFLAGIFIFGGPFLLPLFLQGLRGYPALDTGIILIPSYVAWLLVSPCAGLLYALLDSRLLLGVSLGCIIGGYYTMTGLSLEAAGSNLLPGLLLTGTGIALLNAIAPPAATSTTPRPLVTMATSLMQVMRRIGGNVGYAFIATLVFSRTAVHRAHLLEDVSLYHPNTVATLDGTVGRLVSAGIHETVAQASALRLLNGTVQKQATMLAFNDIFWIMAVLFVLGVPLLWLLGGRARPLAASAPGVSRDGAGVSRPRASESVG